MLLNGEDDRRYTQKVMVIKAFKIHNSIYRLFKLEQTDNFFFSGTSRLLLYEKC